MLLQSTGKTSLLVTKPTKIIRFLLKSFQQRAIFLTIVPPFIKLYRPFKKLLRKLTEENVVIFIFSQTRQIHKTPGHFHLSLSRRRMSRRNEVNFFNIYPARFSSREHSLIGQDIGQLSQDEAEEEAPCSCSRRGSQQGISIPNPMLTVGNDMLVGK